MATPMPGLRALRRLVPYLRPHVTPLTVGLVLVVASAALGSVLPWLLRIAIDAMGSPGATRRVLLVGAGMLGSALVGGVMRFYMRELLNGVSRHVEYDLRDTLFAHLATLDAPFYARWRTGELMARLTNDLSAVRMAAGPAIMYLVNTIAGGAFALAFMLRIDVRLTGLALLPVVALPILTVKLGRAIHDRFESVQEQFGAMTTRAQENLAGVRVVRAYRQERAEEARFATLGDAYLRRNMSLAQLNGIMQPSFALLAGLGAVVVLGAGGTLVVRGTITIGAFVAFGIYLAMLTWPMIALGWVTNLFQRGAASMARLTELLDAHPQLTAAPAPTTLPPRTAGGRRIEFRGVGFHHPPADGAEPRWVLRGVSFVLPAGGTLGVVGAIGSGKSALIDLIPRLYDPQEGDVLIDGVPLRDVDIDTLRREIGFVPQESLLFSDTIAANIRYGLDATDERTGHDEREEPDALARLEETTSGTSEARPGTTLEWAADVAQLRETIAEFPAGYDTLLGERGVNLSGGQKQRAALARALARRPSIVLLDDALSAVDTHTEAEILRGLRGALAGRTTVIASHRISAIRDASWIVVLDEGRIVEQGRHDDLIARDGRYASLLRRQQLTESLEAVGDAEARELEAAPAGAADREP